MVDTSKIIEELRTQVVAEKTMRLSEANQAVGAEKILDLLLQKIKEAEAKEGGQ